MAAAKGLKARVVAPDAARLTRAMNGLGKQSRPVFREVGERVSQVAKSDLQSAARNFSRQSASLASAIEAKRDRVPYVAVKRGGIFRLRGNKRRDAVRAGQIAKGSEFGSRARPTFVAPAHGGTPQRWKAGGYWWNPTIRDNADRYTEIWLDALRRLLDAAARG
jgi:hypothetical protein